MSLANLNISYPKKPYLSYNYITLPFLFPSIRSMHDQPLC